MARPRSTPQPQLHHNIHFSFFVRSLYIYRRFSQFIESFLNTRLSLSTGKESVQLFGASGPSSLAATCKILQGCSIIHMIATQRTETRKKEKADNLSNIYSKNLSQ